MIKLPEWTTPNWLRTTLLVGSVPALIVLGLLEINGYKTEAPVWQTCTFIGLQCSVGLGLLVMIEKWFPMNEG